MPKNQQAKRKGVNNSTKAYLIVGLGNPGPEYKETRHSIGFKVIDLLSRNLGVRLTGRRFQAKNILTSYLDKRLILLCPMTFMNRSGISVRACADWFDVGIRNTLLVHDDLDLSFGSIKVVSAGGAGGHKGVLSVIQHLGSTDFPRVKIGIGRPRYGETIEDYVLASFYADEKSVIERITHMAVHACELFISDGLESTMNTINCQNLSN